ncbi:hypothetical protein FHETE_11084 [Fusarium heterosporum]|uniref:Uncharacterized protein n=1 Tax=Fusarium heterosporum TaxID=42747 RepID=A0A8H5SSN3_FUSHE|nr:hypothetical protein FHETE_11084 [Fusarium heterosporum]
MGLGKFGICQLTSKGNDSTFDTTSNAVLAYAERMKIKSKLIQLSGKNLGLFCKKILKLQDTEVETDVSGIDGKDVIPKTSGPKKDVPDDKKDKDNKKVRKYYKQLVEELNGSSERPEDVKNDKSKNKLDNDATDGSMSISAFGGRGGKGAYSSAEERAMKMRYQEVMKDYLIDEIKILDGSINDLEDGFTTSADHTIEIDDP